MRSCSRVRMFASSQYAHGELQVLADGERAQKHACQLGGTNAENVGPELEDPSATTISYEHRPSSLSLRVSQPAPTAQGACTKVPSLQLVVAGAGARTIHHSIAAAHAPTPAQAPTETSVLQPPHRAHLHRDPGPGRQVCRVRQMAEWCCRAA